MKEYRGHLKNIAEDQDLFLYSRNELPTGKRASLQLHLLTCTACRSRVVEFRRVSRLLNASLGDGPPRRAIGPHLVGWPILPIVGLLITAVMSTAAFVWSTRDRSETGLQGVSNRMTTGCQTSPAMVRLWRQSNLAKRQRAAERAMKGHVKSRPPLPLP